MDLVRYTGEVFLRSALCLLTDLKYECYHFHNFNFQQMNETDPLSPSCSTSDNCSNIHLVLEALSNNSLVISHIEEEEAEMFSGFLEDLGWLGSGEELGLNASLILCRNPEKDSLFTITKESVFKLSDIENIPQIGVFITHLGQVFYFNNGVCVPDSKLTTTECQFVTLLNRYILGRYHIKGINGQARVVESIPYLN